MINLVKNACTLGKIVYKTQSTNTKTTALCEAFCKAIENKAAKEKTTTLFDAYCKTMSQPQIAKSHAEKIVQEIKQQSVKLQQTAQEILNDSGANAIVKTRVKGVDSTASKIQKKFIGFQKQNYESVREQIHSILLGNGEKELVGDSFGVRYILKSETTGTKPNSLRIYNSILKAQKQNPKNFSLTSFEDYYGKGIKPYGNEQIRDKFAQLQYQTSLGKTKETISAFSPKDSGYTRTNINGCLDGVNVEIQVGGIHTTKWGDVEHILYDMRQGKPLDMSKYTPEQKKLAQEIQKAYTEVLGRKSGNTVTKFSQDYLNKVWNTFREAEAKNLSVPIYPEFPAGYPEILKVENILKLAHD